MAEKLSASGKGLWSMLLRIWVTMTQDMRV